MVTFAVILLVGAVHLSVWQGYGQSVSRLEITESSFSTAHSSTPSPALPNLLSKALSDQMVSTLDPDQAQTICILPANRELRLCNDYSKFLGTGNLRLWSKVWRNKGER